MRVRITTTEGNILLELDPEQAPVSTENFLRYVDEGAYNGTIFHRVIPNFMIQGGGFDPGMKQRKSGQGIKNEWRNDLKNVRGSVAMARLGGDPDSASNQFFINVTDNPFLDRPQPDGAGYAVFGKVVEGLDVVDKIKGVETRSHGMHDDVPVSDVVITKAERAE